MSLVIGVARQPKEMADCHPEDAVQQSSIKLELIIAHLLLLFSCTFNYLLPFPHFVQLM